MLGIWHKNDGTPQAGTEAFRSALLNLKRPIYVVQQHDLPAVACDGTITIGSDHQHATENLPLIAYAPPMPPDKLGDRLFKKTHGIDYAYIVGAMANGITSVDMVTAAAESGMLSFFGAAGLSISEIETAIHNLQPRLKNKPFGFNLIHSPNDPALESAVVDLYLKHGVQRVSASAYMDLTLPLVYYRLKGIHCDGDGRIVCPNAVIAKVSRVEVARKFFAPPPPKIVSQLVAQGLLTNQEADLSTYVPVAPDLTAEADSGGHTDNRPAIALLPTMLALRDELAAKFDYDHPLCVGLAGGIATPASAAAAFAMGAAYILTGSVNQACIESGTSDTVRQMLAEADQADVTMAPAADMFELGVKVQVLKRGTMFALRAAKLYDLYTANDCIDSIPANQIAVLEKDFFRCKIDDQWAQTKSFFAERDPKQLELAEKFPKHKMALIFRSYLGLSSNWANSGDLARKIDYQIWCGPSMGAFNEWVKGTFLEKPENRQTVTVALNLLCGAAYNSRVNWLAAQGCHIPPAVRNFQPMEVSLLQEHIPPVSV